MLFLLSTALVVASVFLPTTNALMSCNNTVNGISYDLTPLHARGDRHVIGTNGSDYYINVCGAVQEAPCASHPSAFACQVHKESNQFEAVLAYSNITNNHTEPVWEPSTSQTGGVKLTFKNGDSCHSGQHRVLNVDFQCDFNGTRNITINENPSCTYNIIYPTNVVCHEAPTEAPTHAPNATTAVPTTKAPTHAPNATTAVPTTAAPTTHPNGTTPAPTHAPNATTAVPTTAAPTTHPNGTTAVPTHAPNATTAVPTTEAPTTHPNGTTPAPTNAPNTTTAVPTTAAPTTSPTTVAPTTEAPTSTPTSASASASSTTDENTITRAGLGAGIGIGIGCLAVVWLLWCLYDRRRVQQQQVHSNDVYAPLTTSSV